MAKQKKDKTGSMVEIVFEDLNILKQHYLNLEKIGVTITRQEIRNQIFSLGLHESVKILIKQK